MQPFVNIFFNNLYHILKTPRSYRAMSCLFMHYLGINPYALSIKQIENESFTYGETPLRVFSYIAGSLQKGELFTDIGCGRGKGLLYMSCVRQDCYFKGIEGLEVFVNKAQKITKNAPSAHLEFSLCDLEQMPLCFSDVFYVAGTCFEESLLERIASQLTQLRPRLIFTLSTTLIEYGLKGYSEDEITVLMPWGETSLYIMTKC